MLTRRNWLLRCSIIANLAVLLYMGVHIAVKSSPGDFSYDPSSNGRNLASAMENNPGDVQTSVMRSDRLVSDAKPMVNSEKVVQDDLRMFALDKASTKSVKDDVKINFVDPDNRLDDSNARFAGEADRLDLSSGGAVSANDTAAFPNLEAVIEEQNEQDTEEAIPEVPRDESVLDGATLARLREILKCKDKAYEQSTRQRGEFWVLYNFVMADHGAMGCEESVTYTTHGDFTFLDNLVPLLERWGAPVSLAIHAPGSDLASTVDTIRHLRDCTAGAELVRRWTSFHVFFSAKHIPKQIPNMKKLLLESYNCSLPIPYSVNSSSLYKSQKKLLYPVNVGRNVARDAALTHFVLASDIELYPSPGLPGRFLNMVARSPPALKSKSPRVFPITIFEVDSQQQVPQNKTHLVAMLQKGTAIPFHKKVCAGCHNVPKSKEWILANETTQLDVFHVGKRVGPFIHWEPIFIGTHSDPMYDERLSWEGKSDKMTQAYAMCVMDYDFMILNNAFLVHRPGIKTLTKDVKRAQLAGKTNQLIRRIIFPELKVLYGTKKGCAV